MTTKTALEAADAALEAARELVRRENTQEHREAFKLAWAAREAVSPKQKRGGYACRAGKRQARELRRKR